MPKRNRPSFKIKDPKSGEENDVTSGGVILYRIKNNSLQLLLSWSRGKYEDLGGTVDETDADIYHTISREVEEESNGLILAKDILTRIQTREPIYSKTSKYLAFIVKANDLESVLTSEQFGDKELHDNFERTIQWVPLIEFMNPVTIREKINFRLKNKYIFDALTALSPQPVETVPVGGSNKNANYLF